MLIEAVTLENYGRFREATTVRLAPGLNVLAKPNEWGKSTVVRALSHACFERYNSKGETMQLVRPLGTALSPRVEVIFATAAGRQRLVKTFLGKAASELYTAQGTGWVQTHEADGADARVRELLGAPPLHGKAKVETWGLVRYLWCRQDDAAEWPDWEMEGEAGQTARGKLATVELDRAMRALAETLETRAEAVFTPGRRDARGELRSGREEIARLEAELGGLQAKRNETEALRTEWERLEREAPKLEAEAMEWVERAKALRETLVAGEKQQEVVKHRMAELQHAQAQLGQLQEETEAQIARAKKQQELEANRAALTARQVSGQQALAAQEKQAAEMLTAHQAEIARAVAAEAALRRENSVRRWVEVRDHAAQLAATLATAQALAQERDALLAARRQLAPVTSGQLKRWGKLESSLRESRAALGAVAVQVTLRPVAATEIEVEVDGRPRLTMAAAPTEPTRLQVTQQARLQLPGWGELTLSSGAAEAGRLAEQLQRDEQALRAELAAANFSNLAEAEQAVEELAAAQPALERAEARLEAALNGTTGLEELARKLADAQADAAQRSEALELSAEEQAATLVLVDERLATLEHAERTAKAGEAAARLALEAAQSRLAETRRQLGLDELNLGHVQSALAELARAEASAHARSSMPLADRLQAAKSAVYHADALLAGAQGALPPEFAQLAGRLQRAEEAAGQAHSKALQARNQVQRLEATLHAAGGEGLYSRMTLLEEQLATVRQRTLRLEHEGRAALLLAELIRRRERESVRQVLHPLEERLSAHFAALSGERERRVWFTEALALAGVGRTREEMHPFADLSRGAREQLLLALRAAMADELAKTEGPQCLVLDDVLVHTDRGRHERVLDFLQDLATRVQVLVLTCHAERYRGVGREVEVSPPH